MLFARWGNTHFMQLIIRRAAELSKSRVAARSAWKQTKRGNLSEVYAILWYIINMGFQNSGVFSFVDPPVNKMLWLQMNLLSSLLGLLLPMPWSRYALLKELKDVLFALMFSTQSFLLKLLFPGSVNFAKTQQSSLHLLCKDYFSQLSQFFPYRHISSSGIQHIILQTCSSIARWAPMIEDQWGQASRCPFLPCSSFITLRLCNMLLWSRCGYLKPVSAPVSRGH